MERSKQSSLGGKKRTQGDYNMGFKLAVVTQVEKGELTYKEAQKRYGIQGRSTVLVWLRKHGNLNWTNPQTAMPISKETPSQQIKRLEKELSDEKLKNQILNKMVDTLDRDYNTGLRKKYLPKQSGASGKNSK